MTSDQKKPCYSIGETGQMTGLEPHVLRFWETEFEQLSPQKNSAGRRVYSGEDIEVIRCIKTLLYDKKFTIEGAKNYFKDAGDSSGNQTEISFNEIELRQTLSQVKTELKEILNILDNK